MDSFLGSIICYLYIDILILLVPALLTTYWYLQIYKILKYKEAFSVSNPSRVLWFPLSSLICFLPPVIGHLIIVITRQQFNGIVMNLLFGYVAEFWIFLNLLGYWFLRPDLREKSQSEETKQSISLRATAVFSQSLL